MLVGLTNKKVIFWYLNDEFGILKTNSCHPF